MMLTKFGSVQSPACSAMRTVPPNVSLVTTLDDTTIVVELSVSSCADCCAADECVVISGRMNVVPAAGMARAPIALTTGRM